MSNKVFVEVLNANKKRCTRCLIHKNFGEFHRDARSKDGLNYKCKSCVREYHQANREILIERAAKWNRDNAERHNALRREARRRRRNALKILSVANSNA